MELYVYSTHVHVHVHVKNKNIGSVLFSGASLYYFRGLHVQTYMYMYMYTDTYTYTMHVHTVLHSTHTNLVLKAEQISRGVLILVSPNKSVACF